MTSRERRAPGAKASASVGSEVLGWFRRELAEREAAPDLIDALAAQVEARRFGSRETVFEEGEQCAGLWVMLRGSARLVHLTADGRERVVAFRGPVSVMELVPALDGQKHATTAITLEPSLLALIPTSVVQALRRLPRSDQAFYDLLCQEVRQRDIDAAVATTRTADQRVACTLLRLARTFGRPNGDGSTRIAFLLNRQGLADLIGIRVETASRVVSELGREEAIDANARELCIRQPRLLARHSGCGECQFDCSVFARLPGQKYVLEGLEVGAADQ